MRMSCAKRAVITLLCQDSEDILKQAFYKNKTVYLNSSPGKIVI